jgi:integrase
MKPFLSSSHSLNPAVPLSLSALSDQYREHALTIRSIAEETLQTELIYLQRLFDFFGSPPLAKTLFAKLSLAAIHTFLTQYAKTHGPGSRRWMQWVLRSFLRFAYQSSYLKRDLSPLVPLVRTPRMAHLPRALPEECIRALDAGIQPNSPKGLRDAAIVSLLITYGVRGVQIRRLCLHHLDWEHSRIHFPAAKGGSPIAQHLTPKAGNRLAHYILHGRPSSSHPEVFLTQNPPFRPLTRASYLSDLIRKRIAELGLKLPPGVPAGAHSFRHAFASRMIGRVPFKDLVDMLGHRDPSSTLIYGKIDHAALQEAALPWPGGQP